MNVHRNLRAFVAVSSCLVCIWPVAGCGRSGAQSGQPDLEALRQRAKDTDRDPPTEEEDRTIAALWASISEIAPPATFMGRDPLDKDIAEQNRVFAASEIAQAVKEVGLEQEIPLFLIRGTADAAVHHMSREERAKMTGWEAPVRMTAVACFLIMSNLIRRERGYDEAVMYLQRMNLQVEMDAKHLALGTKMPAGGRQDWPRLWVRLFTASFHRPLLILPTDSVRRDLWRWIDARPSIAVHAADGSVLASGVLSVDTAEAPGRDRRPR